MLSWTRDIPGPGTEDDNLLVKKTHTHTTQGHVGSSSRLHSLKQSVGIFWGRFPLFNFVFSSCLFWCFIIWCIFATTLATKFWGKDGKGRNFIILFYLVTFSWYILFRFNFTLFFLTFCIKNHLGHKFKHIHGVPLISLCSTCQREKV